MSISRSFIAALAAGLLLGQHASVVFARKAASHETADAAQAEGNMVIMNANPKYPYDPATTKYCTWWHDSDGTWSCQDIYDYEWPTPEDFSRWNPSIEPYCDVLPAGKSFCVEALGEPGETTTTTTTSKTTTTPKTITPPRTTTSTTTTKKTTTTTTTGNGIATPTPTQKGMVSNCNKFYKVKSGDNCEKISKAQNVPIAQLAKWNDVGGEACTDLWLDSYVCISIVGWTPPKTTTTTKTTTTKGNGIATPTPTQPGMVTNCNKFYKVKDGDNCDKITKAQGIPLADFVKWNKEIGGTACTGLWKDAYVCVSVIGYTPPKTTTTKKPTTTKGNGVTTPTPTQSGIVSNCKKFYKVKKGQTCDDVAKANSITVANFKKWNKGVGSDCKGMWADTYHCVGV